MSQRVLVVDDDPSVAEFLGIILDLEGFEVLTAASVEQALRQHAVASPDVVITDLHLGPHGPQPGGFELAEALRAAHAHVPVVLMTGDRSSSLDRTARAHGVDAVVAKPFEPDAFLAVVRRLAFAGANA